MDLMTLAAKITLDDSQFKKGVSNAEGMGKQLAGKMSAMTVAVGNIAADMIKKGVSAMTSVIKGAVDGYADYEQLIGGVETLFKSSAGKVEKYAESSYKTTGLSANAYMETVTSFSASLLQGLQGNTEKAADMANMAVTDMADNANKMGTDIGSIQNAYQGFAKQNYTMLDNLKLGYGGTREEMIRLINDSGILNEKIESLDGITFDQIVEAIHEMQTQIGITGTTAEEAASTISGSKASLKAAWEDMLAAAGGKDDKTFYSTLDNFKESFSTYMDNFVPSLVLSIKSGGGIATAIAEAITDLPTQLLSDLGSAVLTSGTDTVNSVSKITHWLIESITNMFKTASANPDEIADFGKAIGDFLGSAIKDIVKNAPDILQGIIDVGVNLAGGLVEGLFKGLFGEDAEVDKIKDAMTGSIEDAEFAATKSGALLDYMRTLSEQYGNAAKGTTEWQEAVKELEEYIPNAGQVIDNFGSNVQGAIDHLDTLAEKMRETAVNAALMNALQDSYALLAQQNIEYRTQEAAYKRNQSEMNTARKNMTDAIKNAASQKAEELWTSSHDENGNVTNPFWSESYYQDLVNWSKGMYDFGNGLQDMGDLDFNQLASIAENFNDNGELMKTLTSNQELFTQAENNAKQAEASMQETAKEIEATKTMIADTKIAVAEASKDMAATFGSASDSITTGGDETAGALSNAAAKINAIKFPSSIGGAHYIPEATGVDYVPYTGFKAELHRGESILTKAEADRYRNGSGSAEIVGAIQNLNSNIQNMQLVVGKKTFGRAVVGYGGNRMNGYIGRAESRRSSGYGT